MTEKLKIDFRKKNVIQRAHPRSDYYKSTVVSHCVMAVSSVSVVGFAAAVKVKQLWPPVAVMQTAILRHSEFVAAVFTSFTRREFSSFFLFLQGFFFKMKFSSSSSSYQALALLFLLVMHLDVVIVVMALCPSDVPAGYNLIHESSLYPANFGFGSLPDGDSSSL